MSKAFLKTTLALLASLTAILAVAPALRAQTRCISEEDIKKMIARIEVAVAPALNEKLQKELVKMKEKYREKYSYAAEENFKNKDLNDDLTKTREKNEIRLCAVLKEFGWPTIKVAGEDGADAALYILRNSASLQFQSDLLPVITAAVNQSQIQKDESLAMYFDRLLVRGRKKQLFGTQSATKGDFMILQPMASEKMVDYWRREYNMPPLRQYIKAMELNYRTPILSSRGAQPADVSPSDGSVSGQDAKTPSTPGVMPDQTAEKEDVVRVDTSLVSLPVFVYDPSGNPMNVLAQNDFEVYENGRKEDITFFSTSDAPFDLVLLIDLSGSTEKMLDLIKNATNKFIERKRPTDKLGIVTFAQEATLVSPLTDDREKLLASVKKMAEKGNSRVWDALKFTLDNLFTDRTPQKRRAVVFLTDGVDNSLWGDKRGSRISFYELFESVKQSETAIFPIYLDTEGQFPDSAAGYKTARSTLALLANETGGRSYKAKKIEDLEGVYSDVLTDLTRIYTIGYIPSNDKRDGAWRTIEIKVPGHTELSVKTKAGYYAK
jgi:VWFA-related protein